MERTVVFLAGFFTACLLGVAYLRVTKSTLLLYKYYIRNRIDRQMSLFTRTGSAKGLGSPPGSNKGPLGSNQPSVSKRRDPLDKTLWI